MIWLNEGHGLPEKNEQVCSPYLAVHHSNRDGGRDDAPPRHHPRPYPTKVKTFCVFEVGIYQDEELVSTINFTSKDEILMDFPHCSREKIWKTSQRETKSWTKKEAYN